MIARPQIIWDKGTAYDLFISLWVIHHPEAFGLRPSWAAGVRSRLSSPLREVLEQSQKFLYIPMNWVHNLPGAKDAQTALATLEALHPADRLPALVINDQLISKSQDFIDFLLNLDGKRRLTTRIEEQILDYYKSIPHLTKGLPRALFLAWSDRKAFGEKLTEAFDAYYENFFREEESRILPALDQAIVEAQALAEELVDIPTLLEALSSGVRIDWLSKSPQVVLAPSFWAAPYIFFNNPEESLQIVLYGKRPKGIALVPGGEIDDQLVNGLKALSDPTRLRIMKYLMNDSYAPSELAKLLRLRAPTVIHHLQILRLAGFVSLRISSGSERRYTIRRDGVLNTAKLLHTFLLED